MQEIWEQIKKVLWDFINGYGKTLALALVFLVVGLTLISILKKSVKRNTLKSRKIDNAAGAFVTSVTTLVAYVFLIVLIIATFGLSTSSLVTAFSSVVIAISLGLQDTLASLANGILLIFTKPFQAGDFVDIGGTSAPQMIIKGVESGGTADPLNQRSTVGWKALFAAVRLQELAMVRIEHAVTA